jgi:hypothetical protein
MEIDIMPEVVENCGYSGKCLLMIKTAVDLIKGLQEDATEEDKISVRNRILANDGIEAEFFGTLTTEPIVSLDIAKARGLKDLEAELVIQHRDLIRQTALSLVEVN